MSSFMLASSSFLGCGLSGPSCSHFQASSRAPKDHIDIGILQNMISGLPANIGLWNHTAVLWALSTVAELDLRHMET